MGTSNWQNIPFCIEVLMKIKPQHVLDVGVGYGRWGMIIREFCEVWYGKVLPDEWNINIEGIEGFEPLISNYHKNFYNKIHVGDARQLIPNLLKTQWDVVIFGDVLEHFEKIEALKLLQLSLESSKYTLINIPLGIDWPQDDIYGNEYERHLSTWNTNDFQTPELRRYSLFVDYIERPFGSFVLSKRDNANLSEGLFSKYTQNAYINNKYIDIEAQIELMPTQRDLLARTERVVAELNEIKSSKSWKLIKRIWGLKGYKMLRKTTMSINNHARKVKTSLSRMVNIRSDSISSNINADHKELILTNEARLSTPVSEMMPNFNSNKYQPFSRKVLIANHNDKQPAFSKQEELWLEHAIQSKPDAITVLHPEWRGIYASAEQMFNVMLEVPDNLEPSSALHYADLLAETGCQRIVFNGFPITYRYLVLALRQRIPYIKLFSIYHGNYNQYREDYARMSFSTVLDLTKAGKVDKLGFVKAGMAEVVGAATGVSTGFLTNWIDHIPEKPSDPLPDGIHLGMWLLWSGNWQKPPFSMLTASLLVPNSTVHGADSDDQMKEYIQLMNIRANFAGKPLPRNELFQAMEKMHVNLYVTFHECSPMLPLESLSLGVPCLLGPVSHYFEDEPYLHEKLVVPYPDRAEVIAEYILKSIEERTEIIKAYQNYAPGYNRHARELLAKFLDMQ